MVSPSIPLAAASCLMMAMTALALFAAWRSLRRAYHALIWSMAFALSSAQWALVASSGRSGPLPLHAGATVITIVDVIGLAAMLLFVEGFRIRAGRRRQAGAPLLVAAITGAILLALTATGAPPALRAAVVPIASAGLLTWAAALVASGRGRSASEWAMLAILALLALTCLTAASAALAERFGWLTSDAAFRTILSFAQGPGFAAGGLLVLFVLASDLRVRLYSLLHTDVLTGVLNRRGFDDAARRAIGRPWRPAQRLFLVIADLDTFKAINDRYGHACGDAVLAGFARTVSTALQRHESIARIGGEEFALLLWAADAMAALGRIEPMRAAIAAHRIAGQPDLAFTASFGIAERSRAEGLTSLLERADRALYRSKQTGRNRATLADRDPA